MSFKVQLPHQYKNKNIIDATPLEGTIALSWFGDMFLFTFDILPWYIPEGLMRVWIKRYHGLEVTLARTIRLCDGDNHVELKRVCQAKLYMSRIDNQWYITVNTLISKGDVLKINNILKY